MSVSIPHIDVNKITTLDEAKNIIELLLQTQALLVKEIALLREEVNRLKGQPRKPSFSSQSNNSSSVTTFLHEKKSHRKQSKRSTLSVDREVQLPEVETCACGCVTFATLRTTRKIVQGLLFKRDTVSYHGRVTQCTTCGKRYRSKLPTNLKGLTFSPELSSFLSFWHYACRVTEPLIAKTLTSMGLQISHGQINNLLMDNGAKLQEADRHLRTQGISTSPHLQSDASGAKRKDKRTGKVINHYVQVVSHKLLSIFRITRKYNTQTVNKLLTKPGRTKLYVSDDGSPNGDRFSPRKQLCWVHEIRHYKKLFPVFNSHQDLQQKILTQWRQFYHRAKHYGETPIEEREEERQKIGEEFDTITTQVTGYDLLDKQLKLTNRKKQRLLVFLDHPDLPIHNNQCEQDLRQFVLIRKISGGTKSVKGDKSLTRHLSVIQTAQKRGLDVYHTLQGLLMGTLHPSVLTASVS